MKSLKWKGIIILSVCLILEGCKASDEQGIVKEENETKIVSESPVEKAEKEDISNETIEKNVKRVNLKKIKLLQL